MERRPLELYIHIPFCVRKCAYCDFLSGPATDLEMRVYVEQLVQEISVQSAFYEGYGVTSIFLGGGTPSILEAEDVSRIMEAVYRHFHVEKDAEVTIEANPGTVSLEKLQIYRASGINRISIGLQSADDGELKALGRIHSYDGFLKTYERVRQAGFTNVNIDLMSALPGQTLESWRSTLRKVLMLRPEHISAYSLIIEEGTPFYKAYHDHPELLPDEETEREMYYETKSMLHKQGFERYEISNYAKPGRECRHNIGYWTGVPYLGLGLGASSYMNGSRFAVSSDMQQYLEEKPGTVTDVEKLTKKDMEEEFFYVGLRMTAGVSLSEFERRFGMSAEEVYPGLMETFVEEKAAEFRGDRFVLTDYGLDVSNYIMAQFLQG